MSDNISKFPTPKEQTDKLIKEMTGPVNMGNNVIIQGRIVPNLVMFERSDEIEFVLDHRLSFSFPRAQAWDAAAFAFAAMAIGAGFAHPSAMHFTQRPFAPECVQLGELPPADGEGK